MKLEARKFDVEIVYTLKNYENDIFTVSKIRDYLLSKYPEKFENCPKIARGYVHAQFRRLEKLKCIERKKLEYGSSSIGFKVTPEFSEIVIVKNDSPLESILNQAIETHDPSEDQSVEKLVSMLQKYNVELLSCLGESEEYNRIYESFPLLKNPLKEKLKLTQERSAKLIGSIRALEAVIEIEKQRVQ